MRLRTGVGFAGLGAMVAAIWLRIGKDDVPVHRAAPGHEQIAAPSPRPPAGPAVTSPEAPARDGSSHGDDDKDDVVGSTDPTSKDYDPVTIVQATQAAASELLKKEPRVAQFADRREAVLQAHVAERLRRLSFETKVNANCRTSSCELTVQGAKSVEDMNAVMEAIDPSGLAEAAQIGSLADPSAPGGRAIQLTLLYSAALRDHAAYEAWLRQRTRRP